MLAGDWIDCPACDGEGGRYIREDEVQKMNLTEMMCEAMGCTGMATMRIATDKRSRPACPVHGEQYLKQKGVVLWKPDSESQPFAGKRFYLQRDEDVSGVSGTGRVAEGIEFINGLVALSWISPHPCVLMYPSIRQIEELHGHQGRTKIIWVDKP